jgi:hypothetical protein
MGLPQKSFAGVLNIKTSLLFGEVNLTLFFESIDIFQQLEKFLMIYGMRSSYYFHQKNQIKQ